MLALHHPDRVRYRTEWAEYRAACLLCILRQVANVRKQHLFLFDEMLFEIGANLIEVRRDLEKLRMPFAMNVRQLLQVATDRRDRR